MTDRNQQPAWPERSDNNRQAKVDFACIRPDGTPIALFKDVPMLPVPKVVTFTEDFMYVDDWAFPISVSNMPKQRLIMMRDLIYSWRDADPSPENKKRTDGILEDFRVSLVHQL